MSKQTHIKTSIGCDIASIAIELGGNIMLIDNGVNSDGGFDCLIVNACDEFSPNDYWDEHELLGRFNVAPNSQAYLLDHDCPELCPTRQYENEINVDKNGRIAINESDIVGKRTISNKPEHMRAAQLPAGRYWVFGVHGDGYFITMIFTPLDD